MVSTDVAALRQQLRRFETGDKPGAIWSAGGPAIDALLPLRGLKAGSTVEWLAPDVGCGAAMLALLAARQRLQGPGRLVVIDPHRRVYPPALLAWGLDLRRVVAVHPGDPAQTLWATVQALRCPSAAVVWGELGPLPPNDLRRLQLAAEAGGSLGLFWRPRAAKGQATWSPVQFWVQPRAAEDVAERPGLGGRRLCVEVLRCRGGAAGGRVELEIDPATGDVRSLPPREPNRREHQRRDLEQPFVPVVSRLAGAAAARRAAAAETRAAGGVF